jgi:hypothetical protein
MSKQVKMNESSKKSYPLFIVGMPRSGTKLLRSLLNEHSEIAIPDIETDFISCWYDNWEFYGDLSNKINFIRFYESVQSVPFFIYQKEKGNMVDVEQWYNSCRDYTLPDVFETLVHMCIPHDARLKPIWGDKSPSYIRNIELLKKIFPEARIIHIVRDVRDYSLSIRNAWGKSMLRAAQRWSEDTMCAHNIIINCNNCLEVKYEDLLKDTVNQLRTICCFLKIEYQEDMLKNLKSNENLGEAKGYVGIKGDNANKYKSSLKQSEIKSIEQVSYETMMELGYIPDIANDGKSINGLFIFALKIKDAIAMIRYESKERGWLGGIMFHYRYYINSGNRVR